MSAECEHPGQEALTHKRIVEALQEAVAQSPVDVPLTKYLMRQSLRVRQEFIKRTPVSGVLKTYPAFKLPGMLLQDAKLHFGIDIFEAIQDKMAMYQHRALIFLEDKKLEVLVKTPIIQVKEGSFSVFIDAVEAVCNIQSTAEAVGTLMAAYYLFCIEYPAELVHTMEFIEHFFCDLGSATVAEPVKRLVTFLKK
ncbi:unnamed protein product [Ixodes hexagonus]